MSVAIITQLMNINNTSSYKFLLFSMTFSGILFA